jgi:hypothetical protein
VPLRLNWQSDWATKSRSWVTSRWVDGLTCSATAWVAENIAAAVAMVNNNRFMIAFSSCLGIKNTGFQERMRNLTNMQYQRPFPTRQR